MRSLSSRFVNVITSIEEVRDILKLSFDDLSSSLQAHEARFNQFTEKHIGKAFLMRGASSVGGNFFIERGRSCKGKGRVFDSQRGSNVANLCRMNQDSSMILELILSSKAEEVQDNLEGK